MIVIFDDLENLKEKIRTDSGLEKIQLLSTGNEDKFTSLDKNFEPLVAFSDIRGQNDLEY